MPAHGQIDRSRVSALLASELETFRRSRPRSLAMIGRARASMPNGLPMAWMAADNAQAVYIDRGRGASFTDLDGFEYVDFNTSDLAMFCGHAHPAIVAAVSEQVGRSTAFMLPTEASVLVAEELTRRYPVSMWQFTLSATQANTEAIRLARAVTGREVVVLFQGNYHGHLEEGLVDLDDGHQRPLQRGLSKGVTGRVRLAQFNDAALLEQALREEDAALVLTEPAMTNTVHLVAPQGDWHDQLRALTRRYGTLLAIDETHTHVVGGGGATGLWRLEPDIVTIGKAIAGGIPLGAYGVTASLGEELDHRRNVATGGTLFGNALSAAAALAALKEILIAESYEHTTRLGARLADGIHESIRRAGLPWATIRFGPRSGQWYGPEPRTGGEARALADDELSHGMRVWLANRGIWDALIGAGPTVPIPAVEEEVDRYISAYGDFLQAIV